MLQHTSTPCIATTQSPDIFYAAYKATFPAPTYTLSMLSDPALLSAIPTSQTLPITYNTAAPSTAETPGIFCACSDETGTLLGTTKPKTTRRREVPPSALRVGEYLQEALALLGQLSGYGDDDDVTVICPRQKFF